MELNGRHVQVIDVGRPAQIGDSPVVFIGRVSWIVSESPPTCVRDNTELDDEFAAIFAEYCSAAGTVDVGVAAVDDTRFRVTVHTES